MNAKILHALFLSFITRVLVARPGSWISETVFSEKYHCVTFPQHTEIMGCKPGKETASSY